MARRLLILGSTGSIGTQALDVVARAAGEAMGRRVIDATDGPGFLVNRCNRPFGLEALRLLQERIADVETIDAIVRAAGFRMGPFELQDLVGIVRQESEMKEALEGLSKLRERAVSVRVPGNREYNPGWHTALDLPNLLTVSEAITLCALERKESRGGHFREDFQDKDPNAAMFNHVVFKGDDGRMQLRRETIPKLPPELQQVVEENK